MLRFGDCVLDVARRELRRGGAVAHLEPQAFDLLAFLVAHRDRVVTKAELLDGVWGHRFVSEAALTTRVKEIRKAVGDSGAEQHTVRNVRGRGYRFVAEVVEAVEVVDATPAGPAGSAGSGLIGRDRVVAEVVDALRRSPLVTITGPGGVGKSTLARAVASAVAGSFDDGVHLVELGTLEPGSDVEPMVARTLAMTFDPGAPDLWVRATARLDALVVLDNCEHVIESVGALLARLTAVDGASVRVVATSTVRIGLSGEEVVTLEPLEPVAARELFIARARAVRRDWAPDEVELDRVDALVARIDRLPLTVEMAAARLGAMSFDELDGAIDAGAPMVQMTHRTPNRRHRSLESLVAWSADLLDDDAVGLFRGFAVFAGPVGVADAAAVVRPERPADEVRFGIADLAERSLLSVDTARTPSRYRMLRTVQSVAERWLDESGDGPAVRRRHALHFAAVCDEIDAAMRTPTEGAARARLDDVVAEVRAAMRWARRHDPAVGSAICAALYLPAYVSFWGEPAEWARALVDASPSSDLHGARVVLAAAAANRGDLAAAATMAESLGAVTTGRLRAAALEVLADVRLYQGRLDEVKRIASELARLGDELDDAHVRTFGLIDSALADIYAERPEHATTSLAGDESGLSPSDRAWLAFTRGEAWSMLGDRRAIASHREAVALGDSVGNRFVVSVAQLSLAAEHVRAGDLAAGLAAYETCLRDHVRHGNFTHAVTALRLLVAVLSAVGDERGAARVYGSVADLRWRTSYGAEAVELAAVVARLRERVGAARFDEWCAEGRALDLDEAVRAALASVSALAGSGRVGGHPQTILS